MLLGMLHCQYAKVQTLEAQSTFFENSPDLIAVFTGDKGRISKALELSLQHPQAKFLISGVYFKNNLKILLKTNLDKRLADQKFDLLSRIVELDFQAQNTFQNVEKTLEFMNQNHSFKNVLIISSDYHLPRIGYILKKLNNDPHKSFHLYGIKTQNLNRKIYQTYLESLKIIKTAILGK